MTLLTRVLAEKRAVIVPLAVALGLNAGIYGLVVYPLTARVASAERRARASEASVIAAQQQSTAVQAAQREKQRADDELETFYQEVLPIDLAGARRITYTRLAALADESNLRHERRSTTAERELDSQLSRVYTTMVLAGEYPDIREFIHRLESAPEFIVIEDVALAQAEDAGAELVLTLGVSTYFWSPADDA